MIDLHEHAGHKAKGGVEIIVIAGLLQNINASYSSPLAKHFPVSFE
jgi:hypothetical protein